MDANNQGENNEGVPGVIHQNTYDLGRNQDTLEKTIKIDIMK